MSHRHVRHFSVRTTCFQQGTKALFSKNAVFTTLKKKVRQSQIYSTKNLFGAILRELFKPQIAY